MFERIDRLQAKRPWVAVPVAVFKKFGEDRAGNLAGLIAYYGFFSLFPLLLVLITGLSIVLSGNRDLQEEVLNSALTQFPVLGDELEANAGELDRSGFALVAGLASALWAGIGVMKAAEDAMNDIWDVPMRERPNLIMAIVRAVGMLVVLGGGILSTTILTGAMGVLTTGSVLRLLGLLAGAVLNTGIFLVGFRVLTVRNVSLRRLLPGAALAGLAWMALQVLGGYLLDHQVSRASQTYGTFAVVIGLLWWLYLLAQVVLLSAELNVVLANRLWPRSLTEPDTEPDRRTLRQHAQVEERHESQDVDVRFHDQEGPGEEDEGDTADPHGRGPRAARDDEE